MVRRASQVRKRLAANLQTYTVKDYIKRKKGRHKRPFLFVIALSCLTYYLHMKVRHTTA
jgi:hypothetical protein